MTHGINIALSERTKVFSSAVTPNPSIERTRTGMALQALTSFWALRALPARAAHVKR